MKTILINAYACNPYWGSEPGMGWNWIINIASSYKVYVITEGEWKENIEKELRNIPYKENLFFYYLPVNERIRQMCWNQGDWRFYYHYRKWQKRAYKLALDILKEHPIDIIHQLNMIGFREPGYLWKIKDIPFVWGPIGGMNNFPESYLQGADLKFRLFVRVKNTINNYQVRYTNRVKRAIKRADGLIAAVPATKKNIESIYYKEAALINETGCRKSAISDRKINTNKSVLDIIWVGKFLFRKQLLLALRSIASTRYHKSIKFHIVGEGDFSYYKNQAKILSIEGSCIWYGKVDNQKVHELMRNVDIFFFTSVADDTSTVVLEALENGLPVLCFDGCGFGAVIDNTVGYKINFTNPLDSIQQFAKIIEHFYENRDELVKLSYNCIQKVEEFSWEEKMKKLQHVYISAMDSFYKKKNS